MVINVLHLLIKPKLKPRLILETVQHNLVFFWFFLGGAAIISELEKMRKKQNLVQVYLNTANWAI